jgi:hypothetical protein
MKDVGEQREMRSENQTRSGQVPFSSMTVTRKPLFISTDATRSRRNVSILRTDVYGYEDLQFAIYSYERLPLASVYSYTFLEG